MQRNQDLLRTQYRESVWMSNLSLRSPHRGSRKLVGHVDPFTRKLSQADSVRGLPGCISAVDEFYGKNKK